MAAPSVPPGPGFVIVGLGASAGGLASFEAFFSRVPPAPGVAFVLVQHLAPDHESLLAALVSRYTTLPVVGIEEGMVVEPDHVYVVPPGKDLGLLAGVLHLLEPPAQRGAHLPIDFFFRSLAQDQRELAIAVVLSGTGSDGSGGIRVIKAEGGMVLAEHLGSAAFDGMPRSAIATGLVDHVLPAAELPAQILDYVAHARTHPPQLPVEPAAGQALTRILVLLRAQTGHDFSQYKQGTMLRRVERRMGVHQIATLDAYVRYLQRTPAEGEALFHDLLIGVTSFFRDPDAFRQVAEQVIPGLFAGKPPGSTIRVWSAGCSTGEEAYSLAILLREYVDAQAEPYKLQVFGTDIDRRAITTARAGRFPAASLAGMSPDRIARFFTPTPGGASFEAQKRVRDIMVFSEHDVVRDPAFSRMDLISCRNVMIYMRAELQTRLLNILHYALNPGGTLFMGASESVGPLEAIFPALDRGAKLFRRAAGPGRAARTTDRAPLLLPSLGVARPFALGLDRSPPDLSMRALAEQALLRHAVPPTALVNRQGDVLYLHGRTGGFLEPAPGEARASNIVEMAREGLRRPLASALRRAATDGTVETVRGLLVRMDGVDTPIDLVVRPVDARRDEAPVFLVSVTERPPEEPGGAPVPIGPEERTNARIVALQRELAAAEAHILSVGGELEVTNVELRSFNEELQSVNEELQATNEELETSKEELLSVNEELAIVNAELETRVVDLSRANNDMNNLLAGTGIGTVFVDRDLRVLRFTPAATEIINLIPTDVGRPLGHVVSNLMGYTTLVADAHRVLETLAPKDVDVQTTAGAWYTMRIRPYRTLENVIEGAVVTFVEITEVVLARDALRAANDQIRLAVVVRDATDAITVQDLDGRTIAWNPGATRLYGWTETEALALNVADRIPADQRDEAIRTVLRLARADVLEPCLTRRLDKAGAVIPIWLTSAALVDASGVTYAIATTERACRAVGADGTEAPHER